MHNTEMQKTVVRMRAEGKSIRSIADELEISPTTVCRWNKEFTADIRESHQQELEDVLDGLHASKLQRTRALVKAFKKIELYIQNKDFSAADLRVYSLFMRLDRYIARDIMHDVPPLPPKHICPDPIINVTTDMPIPPPRSSNQTTKPATDATDVDTDATNAADANPAPHSTAAASYDENLEPESPDAAPIDQDDTTHTRATFIAGSRRRTPMPPSRPATSSDNTGSPGVVNKVLLPTITKGKSEGSPTRDTINIHVDRTRNVTVSKIPKGTSITR